MTNIDERLAEIEGKIASSWALKTRTEYEAELKDRIKSEVLAHATKLAIAALIFISGAGYLFIKSAVLDVYHDENQRVISDLKAKYESNLADERARFEWKRYHDYGKNYVYLAGFYWDSGLGDDQKRKAMIANQFSKAETYFSFAMRTDPQQATTYWELGELFYSYPRKYGQVDRINTDKALHFYQQAVKLYSDGEIAKGWRADPYRMIGKIYLEQAQKAVKEKEISEKISSSREYLSKARDDYVKAVPESRDYNKDGLAEVDEMLQKTIPMLAAWKSKND